MTADVIFCFITKYMSHKPPCMTWLVKADFLGTPSLLPPPGSRAG